jgi:hypothetical protein
VKTGKTNLKYKKWLKNHEETCQQSKDHSLTKKCVVQFMTVITTKTHSMTDMLANLQRCSTMCNTIIYSSAQTPQLMDDPFNFYNNKGTQLTAVKIVKMQTKTSDYLQYCV